jgi:hypothetical protein
MNTRYPSNPLALAAWALAAAAWLLGCASGGLSEGERAALTQRAEGLAAALEADTPAEAGDTLTVRLAFADEVDLDLYVTGPLEETVYFANSPSRIGGELVADARCGSPAPRVEEVRFPAATPGRYRVGVDHPARCDGRDDATAFAVVVTGPHGLRETRSGVIRFLEFLPIVLELELPAP